MAIGENCKRLRILRLRRMRRAGMARSVGAAGIGLFGNFTLDEDFYTRKDLTSKAMGIRVSYCNLDLCICSARGTDSLK